VGRYIHTHTHTILYNLRYVFSATKWYFLAAYCPPGEISHSGLVPCLKCPPGYNETLEGQKYCFNEKGERVGVECLLLPCLNGGSCHSLGPGFLSCDCTPGFIGKFNHFPHYHKLKVLL
jgi:hypothetical protein